MELKSCLNCQFGRSGNICPKINICGTSRGELTGDGVPFHWRPMTEAQKFEADFSKNGKLKGDISTGYYYDTDMARAGFAKEKTDKNKYKHEVMGKWNTFEIMDRLRDLEAFCKKNDILWEITVGGAFCPPECAMLTFTHKSSTLKRSFTFEMDTTIDALRKFEISIIKYLSKEFKSKENNNMSTNYSSHFNCKISCKGFEKKIHEIIDVKFSGPCTIVFWSDGDKTIVRCGDDDFFDKEKGLAMAIAKKFLGTNKSKSNYCNIFKKFIPEHDEDSHILEKLLKNISLAMSSAPKPLYSVQEVSAKIGLSESTIRKQLRDGLYPGAYKKDGKWYIPLED